MASLSELLSLEKGDALAFVGCGGKTSLINLLAQENADKGVLVAPTARIALVERVAVEGVEYLGCEQGEKLIGLNEDRIKEACGLYWLTLMEADGSKGLPLKGWAQHEPVIPDFTTLTVGVLSARSLGLSVTAKNVHRLSEFLALTGVSEGDVVTESAIKHMALSQDGMFSKARSRCAIVINQAEDAQSRAFAFSIARNLDGFLGSILVGSAHAGAFEKWEAS